ncbi:hypothetical protein [Gloeothece verrucosa]|uniref:PEP-CTERM protein-sorting domain-containing protein n=1 Tax=Gloeothece verrucosa (strain PCC 7822) TaxID=497965 RepID=E0U7L4_GLOV7|nr:hypothetical protein [Gloeothece verrucosa]ADN13710.1 hypothetical protein Cyan7822_1722 [Gloeothece verrucosa PCC 7822]
MLKQTKFLGILSLYPLNKIHNTVVIFKRLLIPALAMGALSFNLSPVKAANFYLDSFNYTNSPTVQQKVSVGQNITLPKSVTQSGLSEVLGSVRTLQFNNPLQNPLKLPTAASLSVDPVADSLTLTNSTNVVSKAMLLYNAGDATNGLTGAGVGDWSLGSQYHIDYFRMKLLSLNTRLDIKFTITDINNKIASLTRVAKKNSNGTIDIFDSAASTTAIGTGGLAQFSLTDFANYNNISFKSIKSVQVELTGQADVDAGIDYIKGIEIPEPSIGIGTVIFFGIGLASIKRKKNDSLDDQD